MELDPGMKHPTETQFQTRESFPFAIAEGSIDPEARIAAGELSEEQVAEAEQRLVGDEFFDEIPEDATPNMCMDCRDPKDDSEMLGANAAGGTMTMVVADALTHNSFRKIGEKASQHAGRLFQWLKSRGKRIGGHDADSVTEPACGCGACDKLDGKQPGQPSILGYMIRRGDEIRQLMTSLGVPVTDEQHALVLANAQKLRDENYADDGTKIRQAFVDAAGEEAVTTLTGGQENAVFVSLNLQKGTTLNRKKVREVYGDAIRVFNVDVWSLPNGAEATAVTPQEAADLLVAAGYYNLAAGGTIAGPKMRVIVRS